MAYRFRHLVAYGNGQDCQPSGPLYCLGAGFDFSGDDQLGGSRHRNFVVGAVAYRNADVGASTYGSGELEIWNGVFYGNGWDRPDGGDVWYDRSGDYLGLFNSILQARPYNRLWGWNNSNMARDITPVSANNLYRPAASDSETFSTFQINGGFSSSPTTFANASSQSGFVTASDLLGIARDPRFLNTNDSSYAATDFHLQSDSPAIDKGRFLMRANAAGTTLNTIHSAWERRLERSEELFHRPGLLS